jgi:hypothetical protein
MVINIPCNAILIPTKGDLTRAFNELVKLATLPNIEESVRKEVQGVLDDLQKALGVFPMSITTPVFITLDVPEIEWERRISAIVQEYHLYVQTKILEIISSLIPISFEINLFGVTIDIIKFFADKNYIVTLKNQVRNQIDNLYNLMPDIYKVFDGEFGLESIDLKVEAFWSYLMSMLNNAVLKLVHNAFGALINKFKSIWDALQLPALPDLVNLNVEQLIVSKISSLKTQLQNAAADEINDLLENIITQLESISLVGFSLIDLIGANIEETITSYERKIERYMEAARDFAEAWPKKLIMEWIEKIKEFLDAIGIGALLDWALFDFCKFLKLIGMPTNVTIPNVEI